MRGAEERRGASAEGGLWPPHQRSADFWSGLVISLVGQEEGLEEGLTEKVWQENWSWQSEAG